MELFTKSNNLERIRMQAWENGNGSSEAADHLTAAIRLAVLDSPRLDRRRCGIVRVRAALVVLMLMFGVRTAAQEPLYQEEPFDLVTLDKHNDHAVLRVEPLRRPLPEQPKGSDTLTIRIVDQPENTYEVEWRSIEKVELFEELLLKKANALVGAGQRDEAYEYFAFLERKYPDLPGLAESMQDYLFEEAKTAYRAKHYDTSLVMLRELHSRNPDRAELSKAMGATTEKLVEQYVAREDHRAARTLLDNLAGTFPGQEIVAKWRRRLKDRAAALMAKAREAAQVDNLGEASDLSRQATNIWPELPGALELARDVNERYPRVVVGVNAAAVDPQPGRLGGWASHRSSRLLYRTLVEYVGPGTEGGKYTCPVGEVDAEQFDRRISLKVSPGIRWALGEATLTSYDVARRLLALADPADQAYRPQWSELLAGVTVDGVDRLEVELRQPFVRGDALLEMNLIPYDIRDTSARPPPVNGPYHVASRQGNEVTYLANENYFGAKAGQPMEVVERHFDKGALAIRALRRGEIQILDRVSPWGLSLVSSEPNVVVQPYAAPLVHCLIPNMRKELLASRTFRRALVYGIHREAILQQLAGGELEGCEITSGPFPPGFGYDDPLGYAYDRSIEPRPYEPRLAIALAQLGVRDWAAARKKKGEQLNEMPRLVLAHPAGEIARSACRSIGRQLELVGIPVELTQLAAPVPRQIPENVDLLYAELAMWEPIVDARRLLGSDGMATGCSPYMSLALRQLEQAADWQQLHERLRRVHRIAHEDVAVVPLWQLVDHFAYRRELNGIGAQPIALYQNIEHWRVVFQHSLEGGN